jgi:hypothetical protein
MSHVITEISEDQLKEMIAEHHRLNPELVVREDIIEALTRYVERGILPGGFLLAVLCNDLMESLGRADSYNRASIFQICQYIYNNLPANSHGNTSKVSAWVRLKQGTSTPESLL